MIISIGNEKVYENEFERNFLTQTELYYRHESSEYISQHTCIEYVHTSMYLSVQSVARISLVCTEYIPV
jgi:hypothetical protein